MLLLLTVIISAYIYIFSKYFEYVRKGFRGWKKKKITFNLFWLRYITCKSKTDIDLKRMEVKISLLDYYDWRDGH